MTANEDLIEWNSRWRVSQHVVSCRTCAAQQPEFDRRVPFPHVPGCDQAALNRSPWDDLDAICRRFDSGP